MSREFSASLLFFLAAAFFPKTAAAAVSFNVFVSMVIGALNSAVVPLLFAFAFAFFLWGVFKYFILGGDSDKSRGEGKLFIMWGLIAIAIMLSTWGLVQTFMTTFGL